MNKYHDNIYIAYSDKSVPMLSELVSCKEALSDNGEFMIEQIVAQSWRLA